MKKIAHPRLKILVAATTLSLAMNANAITLTVTDSGDALLAGTLRSALAQIQADTGCTGQPYVVNFAITSPATGEIVIPVGSATGGLPLPFFACTTTINGYSQAGTAVPGATVQPIGPSTAGIRIFLDGTAVTQIPLDGLRVGGANSVVQGLAIGNFGGNGISLNGFSSKIWGNYIGLRANGLAAAPNGNGIAGFGFAAEVGGDLEYQRNVIGSNLNYGVELYDSWWVRNNLVGTAADGITPRANFVGIWSSTSTGANIGGLSPGFANRIAFNAKGVATNSFANGGLFTEGNEIFSNSLIGIDLGFDGPTLNDPLDSDGWQNYPDITSVSYSGTTTDVVATLNTVPFATGVSVEFYGNDDGSGQGKYPIPGCSVSGLTTDAGGDLAAPISLSCAGTWTNLTATASRNSGGSSEFSVPYLTPQVLSAPTSLTFPATPVGVRPPSLPVRVLNVVNSGTPGSTLTIDSIANSAPGEFFDTTGGPPGTPAGPGAPYCGLGSDPTGAPLPGTINAGPCTLNIAFRPQLAGLRTGTLTFVDGNSPGSTLSLTMSGTGGAVVQTAASVLFTPPTLNLPGPTPATSRLEIVLNNSNGGPFTSGTYPQTLPANLVIAPTPAPSVTGGTFCLGSFLTPVPGASSFTVNGIEVPAGGSCTYGIDVTSAIAGSYPVDVAINGLVGQVPISNPLATGTLTVNPPAVPAVQLTPASLAFGNVTVLSSSPSQTVTLTNTGLAPLVLGAFSFTPAPNDFNFLTNCPPTLSPAPGPGNSCTIDLTFSPSLAVPRTTTLRVPSNAATSPDSIAMTGTGVATPVPIVGLSATSLSFPTQAVGTNSPSQVVTLTNTGAAPLLISSVVATPGDFTVVNGCPSTLPAAPGPGNSCPLTITFSPLIAGNRIGDVKVFDNASGSPHTIVLGGVATAPPVPTPVVPPVASFPPTAVGSGFGPVSITLGNSGPALLTVSSVFIVGSGYSIAADGCTGASISLGGSCTVTVNFSPPTAGTITAQLRFITNAPVSTVAVALTGSGTTAPIGTLSASPGSVLFGSLVRGATSSPQAISIANVGTEPVTVSDVAVTGDFAQTNNCSVVLGGGSCTVNVTFTPTVIGGSTGAVTISSNASNPQLVIGLSGTGTLIPLPVIELSANSIAFGNRLMGAAGAGQSVTLKNVGGAVLTISRLYAVGDFRVTHDCPTVVASGESCRLDTSFTASVPGPRGGRIVIESNALGGTTEVVVSGSGCRFASPVRYRGSTLLCQ